MGLNEYIQVGNKIREIRNSQGLSQREIAKRLEIPFSTYSNYENNNREPSFEMLKRIAKVLGVSIAQLVNDEVALAEEAALFDKLKGYFDELGLSMNIAENDRISIDSFDKGTITEITSGELQSLFEGILSDAEKRTEKYILDRLKAEFPIND